MVESWRRRLVPSRWRRLLPPKGYINILSKAKTSLKSSDEGSEYAKRRHHTPGLIQYPHVVHQQKLDLTKLSSRSAISLIFLDAENDVDID
jgi:hypothetical protein